MPTFEQKQDGDYFIRARISSNNSIITWQVSAMGVTFLHKHGVHAGVNFSRSLLSEMIELNLVSTGGSGTQGNLFKPVSSGSTPVREDWQATIQAHTATPHPPRPYKNRISSGKMKSLSSPVDNVNETLPINKKASMFFKKYKRRWGLLVAFPEFPAFWVDTKNSLNGCRLQLDGAIGSLKVIRLMHGSGGASLPVIPQERTYKVNLIGPWPTHLKGWIQDIEGLKPSGTVFNHNEQGSRLNEHEPLLAGKSYYVVISTTNQLYPIPRTIEICHLGSQEMWVAWELKFPKVLDFSIRNWCASIGYAISHANSTR